MLQFARTMRFTRAIALTSALAMASGCGYFFHPERRGNSGGEISGVSLVGDLLWLIPGIIPGVVALAIDFTSGAVYIGGGRYGMTVAPHGSVAIRLPLSDNPIGVDVSVVSAKHRVLAHGSSAMGKTSNTVELQVTEAMRESAAAGESMALEIRADNGAQMTTPLALAL